MRRIRAGAVGCAATLTAVLVAAGCSGTPTDTSTGPGSDAAFVGVADAEWQDDAMVDASVQLAARMVALSGGQNVVVSPTSAQLALAALREGADGAAAVQLDDVLGLRAASSQEVADLRAVLAEYEGDVAGVDPASPPQTPVLHIADALFVPTGADVGTEFLGRAAAFHRADVLESDAAADGFGGASQATLDAWVAAETGGLLTQAPAAPVAPVAPVEEAVPVEGAPEATPTATPTPPAPTVSTSLVVMNVVTFAAAWLHPFAQASTADGPFTLPDGTVVQVPMMSQTLTTSYAESETWRAVELAFTDGFVMDIAIAADGGSPAWTSVTDGLDDASEQSVHVVMPRWRTGTVIDLLPMLKGMGVGAIARPGNLDALYDAAFASAFAQGVTITVAEGGAVASAATQADVDGAAESTGTAVELVLDRPFEYHVVHEATGLVLFAGRVANPSV